METISENLLVEKESLYKWAYTLALITIFYNIVEKVISVTFHIKVYSALTGHGTDVKTLPKDVFQLLSPKDSGKKFVYFKTPSMIRILSDRLIDAIHPLIKANKLGFLLFQYPLWFHYRREKFDYILFYKDLAQGLPIAVEFRHGSWLTPERKDNVFDFLRKHQITYVTADEPQYGSLVTIPFVPPSTTDTAYFRLHGRNKENWLKKGVETSLRYDYLYNKDELKSFVPHIQQYSKQNKQAHVMFNNCHSGFAMRNALEVMELLEDQETT